MANKYTADLLEAFTDAPRDEVLKFLEWLRESLYCSEENVRRSIVHIVLAVAIFELVAFAASDDITIGPLKIPNTSLFLALIPPYVAYAILQSLISTERYDVNRWIFKRMLETWQPKLDDMYADKLSLPEEVLYIWH
jgi:hypothetical protein